MNDTTVAYMSTKYGVDFLDGDARSRLVVTGDYVLTHVHHGGVHVESGQFQLDGIIQGSLDIQAGVHAIIHGVQQGSVSVACGALVVITGSIEGSVTVARGGAVVVENRGKLAGSLHNDGEVTVRGVFGGSISGIPVRLEGNGYIKQPIVREGINYYEWQG